jgi:putative ABC transport system permease protein
VVLKGRFATGQRGKALRQGLVVGQFAISVALIAATSIVFSQLRHVQDRDLGLDLGGADTQLLLMPFMGDSTVVANLPEIRARLAEIPGVAGATTSLTAPTYGVYSAGGGIEQPDGTIKELSVAMYMADTAYAAVYGLDLVAGKRADERPASRPREYVLNETAARLAGYADPASALGIRAGFWGMEGEVVGVVRDFHVEGLQKAVEPLALTVGLNDELFAANVLTVRVRTAALPRTLAAIEALWADAAPSRPFEYSFLDDDFAAQYAAERRFGKLFGAFSGLAILISCLGLFGLTAHAAAQRTKEIGVRRVLGASVAQVVALLGRDVVGLVGVGVLIAVPVVWMGMGRWLDGFAYRIPLSPTPLVSAALIVLAFAVAVVAAHAVRAATADPVRALRSE